MPEEAGQRRQLQLPQLDGMAMEDRLDIYAYYTGKLLPAEQQQQQHQAEAGRLRSSSDVVKDVEAQVAAAGLTAHEVLAHVCKQLDWDTFLEDIQASEPM